MIPEYECLKCGELFEGWTMLELATERGVSESDLAEMRRHKANLVKSGPHIFHLKCGSLYVKWLNYKE